MITMLFSAFMFNTTLHAGFEGQQAGTSLKLFNVINCSTGLTCTRVKDKFTMVSSPTVSGAAITITGAEATDGILNIIADEGDDDGDDWAIKSLASGNSLVFQNNVGGSLATLFSVSTAGALSVTGDLSGDGGDQLVGFLQNRILATATTLTAAQCGSTVYNGGAVEIELPEASTVLGCRYTFVTANAANFDIDPDGADQILVQTNAAGDMIRNATLGNTITIEAISASQWAVVGILGTWADAN